MFKQLKLMAGLAITATLVACGGGGESDSSSVSVNNPLKKYEGTWYVCNAAQKFIYSISTTGTDGLTLNYSEEIYDNMKCEGPPIASYKSDASVLITYKGTTSATLPVATVLPSSATVDSVTILTSPSTATLTGPGVKDDCVTYYTLNVSMPVRRKRCIGPVLRQRTTSGALYLTADNQYLVTFEGYGNGLVGAYEAYDTFLSRSPSFDLLYGDWQWRPRYPISRSFLNAETINLF